VSPPRVETSPTQDLQDRRLLPAARYTFNFANLLPAVVDQQLRQVQRGQESRHRAHQGGLAVTLAQSHAHLHGIGFDLAPVAPLLDRHVTDHGVSDRLAFQAGDMFSDPFPASDVITMGHVIHDWSLAERHELLKKAHAAAPEGGAVIVFEAIIDDDRRENVFGLLMSLNMLIETPAGSDYTGADCQGWMDEIGFRETYVEHLAGPDSMVVGLK
jgi:hypothetical protein